MNNPIVKLLIVGCLVLGGGYWGMKKFDAQKIETEHKLDLERIRKEYLERQPFARSIAEPEKYAMEQRALWKWYFGELTEHYNRFPRFKNYDRFLDDIDAKHKSKKLTDADYAQYEERFKLTKGFWDMAKEQRYEPVWTAYDHGMRFDVFKVETISDPKEPKLKLWVALSGAQRKLNVERSESGARTYKMTVNSSFQDLQLVGFDAKDKQQAKLNVAGDPMKIDHPERWIEEFPPGHVFAYYELPMMPSEIEKATFTWTIATRSVVSGEEAAATFEWKTPLKPEWKLAPGVKWEGAQEEVLDQGEDQPKGKTAHR